MLSVKVSPQYLDQTIGFIKSAIDEIAPDEIAPNAPFEYYFVDEKIDRMYKMESQLGQLFSHFSILSIVLACLGLIGLTSYSIMMRTKEIGIRKVLGAPVPHITAMLSSEFTKWAVFASVIAWPTGYYLMNAWLQNFAYRVHVQWWLFAIATGISFGIALFTVSIQTIKASTTNPVESLRYE